MRTLNLLIAAFLAVPGLAAAECEMFVQVMPPQGVPQETADLIVSRLERALTADGTAAAPDYGQFYLTARCSDVYKETLDGSPAQTAVHTELTLGVADIEGGTVFATKTFDLRGVGTSENRAYINALSAISGRNEALKDFVNDAKKKTIRYFDTNYRAFLGKAKKAASMRDFEQALYYATLIPECSTGYSEASKAVTKYYQAYIDDEGLKLLNEAKALFAVSPNADGAVDAYALINRINPQSSAYKSAMSFAEEVKRQTKAEYDFEVHKKYEDAIGLRRQTIDAAREVGVAFGKGQKQSTTNLLWK